jgi:hypothetical protein
MLSTLETRWFYEGSIPQPVLNWFHEDATHLKRQSPRVDYYLRLKNGDSQGVKLREGRIEVKERQRQYGIVQFHDQVVGVVEAWRKVSRELSEISDELARLASPKTTWIGVEKERIVRRFRVVDLNTVEPSLASESPTRGCNLELTAIQIYGLDCWTIGFEAYGDEMSLEQNLSATINTVLDTGSPPSLDAEHSFGYPRWLQLFGLPTEGELE